MATLTYNYADSTAVLGPLSTYAEPHSYDLCAQHAERTTAPRGWEVVRLITDFSEVADPTDDLTAVADAVRSETTPADVARRAESVAGPALRTDLEPQRLPGLRYPERIAPLRRDLVSGGDTLPPRSTTSGRDRLRVLRDGEAWGMERGAER